MTGRSQVYLDHAASSPLKPDALQAMTAALALAGNPSSIHRHGRAVRKVIEDARVSVATLAGVASDRVIFTSGATEANAMALSGFPGRPILVSAVEHDSVLANAAGADRLDVDGRGIADLGALELWLRRHEPALVSLMLVNNETGVIQPVADAARMIHAAGGLLHVDAVQGAGRVPVTLTDLGADLMTISAHKLGGPTGIGALVVNEAVEPRARSIGGGQERRRRAGTENVAGIAGFGAAVAAGDPLLDARLTKLRVRLESILQEAVPGLRVIGAGAARVGAISCLVLPGHAAETQVMALDLAGFSVGSGAACSSGRVRPSHVLSAVGEPEPGAAIRISLGWTTTDDDVDRFARAWIAMAKR